MQSFIPPFLSLILFFLFLSPTVGDVGSDLYVSSHLGTKTPYSYSTSSVKFNPTPVPPGYELIYFNLLQRHGARYPTSGSIKDIGKLMDHLNPYLERIHLNPEFSWLLNWNCPYCDQTQQGILKPYGSNESYQRGRDYLSRFPEIFSLDYNPNIFSIQTTDVPRTSQSGSSFTYGVWENTGTVDGKYQPISSWSESQHSDTTLRFFDNCPTWQTQVDDNPASVEQLNLWRQNKYPKVRTAIGSLLTADQEDWSGLTDDDIDTMFDLCSYDLYLGLTGNYWCQFWLDPSLVDILEYTEDLENYWQRSYGYPLNYQITANLVSNITWTMDEAVSNHTANLSYPQVAYLRFAHAETFIPFVSALGLFNDSYDLTANTPDAQIASRTFRSSLISPYAANLAILLYFKTGSNSTKDALIRVVMNEQEKILPGCGQVYCSFDTFKNIVQPYTSLSYIRLCGVHSWSGCDDNSDDTDVSLVVVILSCLASVVFGFMVALFLSLLTSHLRTTTGMYTSYS